MNTGDLVVLAFLLDLWWGDPRWLPHPVNAVARFAKSMEGWSRRILAPKLAGILTTATVVAATGAATWVLIHLARALHPMAGTLLEIGLLYTCFATKSLVQHAEAVRIPLQAGNFPLARKRVGWMVGRDTHDLDEAEVTRATLESVGENTVDGITGPLLFALLGGPVGAMVYKAASTLDSLFGYRNQRYLAFGWAAARLDDFLTWLPARLTGPLMLMAGLMPGFWFRHGLEIYRRDRLKHPSPNAAHGEAALAGLLGVQLGGPSSYHGKISHKAQLGDPLQPLHPGLITKANVLACTTAVLGVLTGWLLWFHLG